MNDLDLLDRFGPSADEPTDATLAAARARLDAAMASPAPAVRRPRRLPLLVAASVVAAGAVGVAVAPAFMGSDDSIALAAVDPLAFPWTPATLPAGLRDPVFDKDRGHFGVSYGTPDSGLSIFTRIEGDWDVPSSARGTEVNGEAARVFERERNGVPTVTVAWTDDDEGLTWVTGRGPYASAEQVVAFAQALQEKPLPVDLSLTVAPDGWTPQLYKADRILTLVGADNAELTVSLLDHLSPDFSNYAGPRDVHSTVVDGRPATAAKIPDDRGSSMWVLETTAADGQAFQLQAPEVLTEEQVIEIAAGVRHR